MAMCMHIARHICSPRASLLFDIISILFIGILTLILDCIRNAVIRLGFQFTHGVNPHWGWHQSMHIFYLDFFLRFKFTI